MEETDSLQMQWFKGRVIYIIECKTLHIHCFGPLLASQLFSLGVGKKDGLGLVAV